MTPLLTGSLVRLAALSTLAGVLCMAGPASAFDAGGQAALMQQHSMMRNQSTGDGPDWIDREAQRRKNNGKVMRSGDGPAPATTQRRADKAVVEAERRRMMQQRKRELLPEYERRTRTDGKASADRWLRAAATEAGRRDGATVRARIGR